jgi:hypothetical protein
MRRRDVVGAAIALFDAGVPAFVQGYGMRGGRT